MPRLIKTNNYLFLLYTGKNNSDPIPITIIDAIPDDQIIQPKAVPTVKGMLNKTNTPAIAAG